MRITCRDCRGEFILSPDQVNPNGMRANCPFCGLAYELLRAEDDSGEPRIVFPGDKGSTRTCINCSKEFESVSQDVIPVCPACKQRQSEPLASETRGRWMVHRHGKPFTVDSEVAIREQIRQGLIFPDDLLEEPSGRRQTARRFSQFTEAFRDQKRRQLSSAGSGQRFTRRFLSPGLLLRGFGVTLLSAGALWAAYRAVFFHPSSTPSSATLDQLAERFKKEVVPASRPPEALLDSARQLLWRDRSEDYDEARKLLEQAFVADPQSPSTLPLLAIAYANVARSSSETRIGISALTLAGLVQRLQPTHPEGWIAQARAALSSDNAPTALEASQTALDLDPAHPLALLTRARVILETARSETELSNAALLARRAIEKDATLLEAYDILGGAYARGGEPDQAAAAFEQRLVRSPDDPKALYRLGALEERAAEYRSAEEWYQRALRESSTLVSARLALALLYSRTAPKPDLAIRHLQEIVTRYQRYAPSEDLFRAQTELIRLLIKRGDVSDATALLADFPAKYSTSTRAHLAKALVKNASHRVPEATATLEEATRADPSSAEAALALARSIEKSGTPETITRAFRAALDAGPLSLDAYYFFAIYLLHQDRLDEALDVANAAVTRAGLSPSHDLFVALDERRADVQWEELRKLLGPLRKKHETSPIPDAFLGLTYLDEGLTRADPAALQKAVAPFQRAQRIAPNLEFTSYYLGWLYSQLGRHAAAADLFRSSLRINPLSVAARYGLASSSRRIGNLKNAKSELEALSSDKFWGCRALGELGEIALTEKNRAAALHYWHESLKAEPRYIPSWRALLRQPHG